MRFEECMSEDCAALAAQNTNLNQTDDGHHDSLPHTNPGALERRGGDSRDAVLLVGAAGGGGAFCAGRRPGAARNC